MKPSCLVVRNQDDAFGKVELYPSIRSRQDLAGDRLIATDAYRSRTPDLGHDACRDGKRPFRHGHEGVIPFTINKVEGSADVLSDDDTGIWSTFSKASRGGPTNAEQQTVA